MDLSIIIVNWNTRDLLLQCLGAVYQTVRAIDMEVFVVDNGSKDGSAAAVVERFPGTRVLQNQINFGFARANNQALNRAEGKYLLLLNPDTVVRERAIENLLSLMEADPKAGAAGGQLVNPDGSKQNSIVNFPTLATELLNKSLLRWLFPGRFPGKENVYGEPIEVESVIGACMMVRGETVEEVGRLDEGYFLFLEETDWCYRMKKAGWKIYHVPAAQIYHFQGKSAKTDIKGAKIEYYRSRYRFFQKHYGKARCALLAVGLALKLGTEFFSMLVGCTVTFFMLKGWRKRLSLRGHLLWWHLRLCPEGMGLRPEKNDI
ncbi:MAG: glycosyltransferase family 2 protein [Thermodesulfobacteriota bacterium]